MKKLDDNEKWLTGLLVTEITAHILLSNYIRGVKCKLTQHLFSMILSDEARHISFATHYLKISLKGASESDRQYSVKIVDNVLKLTLGMLEYYQSPLKSFQIDFGILFGQIKSEVRNRVAESILGAEEWPHPRVSN